MIICDGMRADMAFEEFGYCNSLCDNANIGIRTTSIVDNPSVSRTNYETMHTGVPALVHGITSNLVLQPSKMSRNVFRELSSNNKTTAIVGSSWFYDLYGKDPKYIYVKHKEINPENGEDITYGRFFSDDVPDSIDSNVEGLAHTFQTSDHLLYKYFPDYLLIHLVTPDKIGHHDGIGQKYRNEISKIDSVLGATLPRWIEMGYDIIITSDHGMDTNHNHGSSKCEVKTAPLYIISKKGWKPIDSECSHTDIAPMIVERVLPGNDFRTYCQKLILNSGIIHKRRDCIE
jgi:predicted AlkP superfamily pyrophosphatase or phosphodiesterase